MNKGLIILCLLLSVAFQTRSFALEVTITTQDKTPVIDGELNDSAWKTPPSVQNFRLLRSSAATEVLPQTQAWLVADTDALYIASRCEEPNMVMLVTTGKNHDDPTWKDDCLEIFLDPTGEGRSYAQIVVNAAGVIMDGWKDSKLSPLEISWGSGATAAAKQYDNYWTLEVRIPFDRMPIKDPKGTWLFNLARHRAHTSENFICLPGNVQGNHDIEKFARLKGLHIQKMNVALQECDFGDCLIGSNTASVRLKNWGTVAEEVSLDFAWFGQSPTTQAVSIPPQQELTVTQPWEISRSDKGKTYEITIRSGKKVLRRQQVNLNNLADIFADDRLGVLFLHHDSPTIFRQKLDFAQASQQNYTLAWEILNDRQQCLAEGQTSVRNRQALLRFFWTFAQEGHYILKMSLARDGQPWVAGQREVRFVRSPWEN